MKTMIGLLFLAAVAVYAQAEIQYHPKAIMHYLEMEDREMAGKVRRIINLDARAIPTATTARPNGFPTGVPPRIVSEDPPGVLGDMGTLGDKIAGNKGKKRK